MESGFRLALSFIIGGVASLFFVLLLLIAAAVVIGGPPSPKYSVTIPFIWIGVGGGFWVLAPKFMEWAAKDGRSNREENS